MAARVGSAPGAGAGPHLTGTRIVQTKAVPM